MKQSILLAAIAICIFSCKKETTTPTYQIATTSRDSSNKAIFNGAFTQETEKNWLDYTGKTEEDCKNWLKTAIEGSYRPIPANSHGDTAFYTRRLGYYRIKP